MKLDNNIHLSKEEIIKNGTIFTPKHLVELTYSLLSNYIDSNSIIGDFGSGYGAFIEIFKNKGSRCFGTEYDPQSFDLLKNEFKNIEFYHENSLLNIKRQKYNLSNKDNLIIVGNPPYNDITSIYQKGKKGKLDCDKDVLSRDFGISFLKAYDKLNANYVCILHPLAYLIKKQNFNSLGMFKNNYKLLNGVVFSSKEFLGINKNNNDFPVVAALYRRDEKGMIFDDIYNFSFEIYNSNKTFILKDILTIDGKVNKYPIKNAKKELQFYTLRDMNALLRNASFTSNQKYNGLDVDINNLYQYSWLFFLKKNFNPLNNKFLYGNLSPLYTKKIDNDLFKNIVVSYAYNNCPLISNYLSKEEIEKKYGSLISNYEELYIELDKICKL